jgi:hypothetical protein
MADYPFEGDGRGSEVRVAEQEVIEIERAWNDHRASFAPIVPADDEELASILGRAIESCSDELTSGASFGAKATGRFVEVERRASGTVVERLIVGICNKGPQGGGLGRQVEELLRRASDARAITVRSSSYPSSPTTNVGQLLRDLVEGGGRQVVVEDSDWRMMITLAGFKDNRSDLAGFGAWRTQTRPLTTLQSVRAILDLEA